MTQEPKRGPGARKIELERRLDANAEISRQTDSPQRKSGTDSAAPDPSDPHRERPENGGRQGSTGQRNKHDR